MVNGILSHHKSVKTMPNILPVSSVSEILVFVFIFHFFLIIYLFSQELINIIV